MKQTITTLIILILAIHTIAGGKKGKKETVTLPNSPIIAALKTPEKSVKAILKYEQAKKWADGAVAIDALHNMLVNEPNNLAIKDTLMTVYFYQNKLTQAGRILPELIASAPNDIRLLEMQAIIYKNLGYSKHAIASYQKLFTETKNPSYGYEVATMQFEQNKHNESMQTASLLLLQDLSGKKVMTYLNNGQQQEADLKAALNNLIGTIHYIKKEYHKALTSFDIAIEIAPEFVLAKRNKKALMQEIAKQDKEQ